MNNNNDILKNAQNIFSKILQTLIILVIVGVVLYLTFFISLFFVAIFLGLFAISYIKLKMKKKRKYYKIKDIKFEK